MLWRWCVICGCAIWGLMIWSQLILYVTGRRSLVWESISCLSGWFPAMLDFCCSILYYVDVWMSVRPVTLMLHFFRFADCINTKYATEICINRSPLHICINMTWCQIYTNIVRVTTDHPLNTCGYGNHVCLWDELWLTLCCKCTNTVGVGCTTVRRHSNRNTKNVKIIKYCRRKCQFM